LARKALMTNAPDKESRPLPAEAAIAADRLYQPFPAFSEWIAAGLDTSRWDRLLRQVMDQRIALGTDATHKAFELVKRAAAVDTGALEGLYTVDRGFTFTIAAASALWEQSLAERGSDVRALVEAQMDAYDLAVDVATKASPITEALVRRLHEEICRAQPNYSVQTAVGPQKQQLPLGEYKRHPNHVRQPDGSIHAYCPVDLVPEEMHRLMTEIATPIFDAAHPVLQASYAHYGLVGVHPFADGNGRVARLLASVYLCRGASIPFLILSEEQRPYWEALALADQGQHAAFTSFVMERAIDTLRLVSESLTSSASTSVEESATKLRELANGNERRDQVEGAANRLTELLQAEVVRRISEQVRRGTLQADASRATTPEPGASFGVADDTYRPPIGRNGRFRFDLRSPFAATTVTGLVQVEVPKDSSNHPLTVRVLVAHLGGTPNTEMRVELDEIVRASTKVLELRISLLVERLFAGWLDELRQLTEREVGRG
jgi:Fic family protein